MASPPKVEGRRLSRVSPTTNGDELRLVQEEYLKQVGGILEPKRGGFDVVRGFFHSDAAKERLGDALSRFDLSADGAEYRLVQSLGHRLDPQRFERVSKSKRVSHGIDVYAPGRGDPVMQLYVKTLEGADENDRARLCDACGWTPRNFNQFFMSGPVRHHGDDLPAVAPVSRKKGGGYGFFVEERMPKGSSIRNQGINMDSETSRVFARKLAASVRQMIDNGLMFNFNRYGATNVRVVPKVNPVCPLEIKTKNGGGKIVVSSLSSLLDIVEVQNGRSLGIDLDRDELGNWVEHRLGDPVAAAAFRQLSPDDMKGRGADSRLAAVVRENMFDVKFVGAESFHSISAGDRITLVGSGNVTERIMDNELVRGLTGVYRNVLGNLGERVMPDALGEFDRAFRGPDPTVFEQVGESARSYLSRCGWLGSARTMLSYVNLEFDPSLHGYWQNAFSRAQAGHSTSPLVATTEAEEVVSALTNELAAKGVRGSVGRCIASDFYGDRVQADADPRDVRFVRDEVAHDSSIITAQTTSGATVKRYVEVTPSSEYIANFDVADNAGVAPPQLETNEEGRVVYPFDLIMREVRPDTFNHAEAASAVASTVVRAFEEGIVPDRLDPNFILFSQMRGQMRCFFTNWHNPSDMRKTSPKAKVESMKGFLVSNADVIRNLGDAATWKAFRQRIITSAHKGASSADYELMFDEVEQELAERPEWGTYLYQAARSLIVKGEFRENQMRWLDDLRDRPMPTSYHPRVQEQLREAEPRMHECIQAVFDHYPGHVQDLIADIRHCHLLVPGDENTLVDAKLGNVNLSTGTVLFKLYQLERGKPRKSQGALAVSYGPEGVTGMERMSMHQLDRYVEENGLVSPAAYKVHLRPDEGGEYEVEGQRYGFQWNNNYFKITPEIQALKATVRSRSVAGMREQTVKRHKRDLDALRGEVDVEQSWERSLQKMSRAYVDWYGVFKTVLDARDGLPEVERPGFMRAVEKKVDPRNPEFICDGRVPSIDISIRKTHPELIDQTCELCFPRLDHRLSQLFTLEDASEHVFEQEKKQKSRLSDKEKDKLLERLVSTGEVSRVVIAGSKPSEFITGMRFRQDNRHTVVELDVMTEKGPRKAILKNSDLLQEVLPQTILMHIRDRDGKPLIQTPHMTATEPGYSVMTLMHGQQLRQASGDDLRGRREDLLFRLGAHMRVSHVVGDGHSGNFIIPKEGGLVRIDMEDVDLFDSIIVNGILHRNEIGSENIGCHPHRYELGIARSLFGFGTDPEGAWRIMKDGMKWADEQLKKPGVREDIAGLVDRLSNLYPMERTRLTESYKDKLQRSFSFDLGALQEGIAIYGYAFMGKQRRHQEQEFWASQIKHFKQIRHFFDDEDDRGFDRW